MPGEAERLTGAGRRWDADNAEAVLASEAPDRSGAWKNYWPWRRRAG